MKYLQLVHLYFQFHFCKRKGFKIQYVDWGKLFPVPNYDINKYPECRKFVEMGYHNAQFNFRLDSTRIGEIFQGQTPSRNGPNAKCNDSPRRFPNTSYPEMLNEHSPGLKDMSN